MCCYVNTEHIKYLLETIKCGSINKASEKLNINHQHLGRILTSLENEIGVKILVRSTVGISLTPQGKELIGLIENLDNIATQLLKYSNMESYFKYRIATLNIYSFASSNYASANNFALKLQTIMPNIVVNIIEAANEEIIDNLMDINNTAIGNLISFDDYPSLIIDPQHLPENISLLSKKHAKLVALCSSENPLVSNYATISLETLIHKPLIFYTPYKLEKNHFYKLAKLYGEPRIVLTTTNLQSFYQMLKSGEFVAIGATFDNIYSTFNPIFSGEQQLRTIPIRNNVQMSVLRVVNKISKASNNIIVRDMIEKIF